MYLKSDEGHIGSEDAVGGGAAETVKAACTMYVCVCVRAYECVCVGRGGGGACTRMWVRVGA